MKIVDWEARIREGQAAARRSDAFARQLRRGFVRWQHEKHSASYPSSRRARAGTRPGSALWIEVG